MGRVAAGGAICSRDAPIIASSGFMSSRPTRSGVRTAAGAASRAASKSPDPGPRASVSIREVAAHAQVAIGTVSRVINGHPSVSDDRRQRVLAAIDALGYVPDIVAQSMRNRRSMTFACVMRDFTVPILSLFIDSMQKEVDAHGFSLMYASSYHDVEHEVRLLKGFAQRRIDGLVIASSSEDSPVLLQALRQARFPVVLIDRDQPAEFDSVRVEHAVGIGDAVRYLAHLGHRRIAIISGEPGVHPTRDRLRGYREAMQQSGLPIRPDWMRAVSFSTEAGYQETRRLLALHERPTALIAGGSALLPGLLAATREAGISVPTDLSVIAGADSDVARLSTPAITSVHWSHDALGRAAGQFLMKRLASPNALRQEMRVRAELLVRGSCAPPRSA